MRYTYKGDKLTEPALVGLQCDPVRRPDEKCIVSVKMATALVVDSDGHKYVVLRRKLRLNKQEDKIMQNNLSPTQKIVLHQAEAYRQQAGNLSHGAALGGWFTPSRYELAPVQCTIATCKALCAKGLFEYRVAFEAINGMPAILEFRVKEQEGKMDAAVNARPATKVENMGGFTELASQYLAMKNNPGDLGKEVAYFRALADARLTDFYAVWDQKQHWCNVFPQAR